MRNKNHKIDEIRSDEVREILGKIPHWTIRWGITVVFLLIFLLCGLSWFIKYPDYITGTVIINTTNPPAKIISQGNGQIIRINFNENDRVKKGDFLAEIKNPLTQEAVVYLKNILDEIKPLIKTATGNEFNLGFSDKYVFGNIQGEYNQMLYNLSDLNQMNQDNFSSLKIKNIEKQIDYYSRLVAITHTKMKLSEQEYFNSENTYQSNKKLYKKNILSKTEFFEKESDFFQKKRQLEDAKQTYVQNNVTRTEYENQLLEFQNSNNEIRRKLKDGILGNIEVIENELNNWQQKYIITAPISGYFTSIQSIKENDFIESGSALFAIIPNDNSFIGIASVTAFGFGKIENQQKVIIKLDSYPYQEFGYLKGKVNRKYQVPYRDKNSGQYQYKVDIELPEQLETSHKIEVELKGENSGTIQIVTKDKRLIDRILSFLDDKISR